MSVFQDSTLTQGERLVWFAVRELAAGGLCRAGPSGIADHMESARAHVSRCIRALADRGWIERTESGALVPVDDPELSDSEPCGNGSGRDSESRNRDSQSRSAERSKGFPAPPFVFPQERISFNPLSESHPTLSQVVEVESADADRPPWTRRLLDQISWSAEPLPEDHPARWDYLPGDWRWEAGLYALSQLAGEEMLNTHYRTRLLSEHPGKIASEWADTFRLLIEQDGWRRPEVAVVMKWLFETDNWWRRNRTIQAVPPLRRTDESGTTKFDKIAQSALADYEQRQRDQDPSPAEAREAVRDAVRRVSTGDGAPGPAPGAEPAERELDVESW